MEKFWLKNYPEGVKTEIDPDVYSSIKELFETSCKEYADKPAYQNMGHTITFGELDRITRNLAAYMQQTLGLQKGDKLAIVSPNIIQYPVVMFAAFRIGLIVVNMNPLYTAYEMRHTLEDSQAKAVMVLANFAKELEKAIPDTNVSHVIVTELGDMFDFPKRQIVNAVVKYVKHMVPRHTMKKAIKLRDAISAGERLPIEKIEVSNTDIAYLQYTGGTTGVPKAAMLTHRNMIANVEQMYNWYNPFFEAGKEHAITALPMYHIFCLTCNILLMVKMGGCCQLITNPRDITGFVKELIKSKFTSFVGVNTLFNALLHNEDFHKVDFKDCKICLGGGMAVQESVANRWIAVTKKPLMEGYGLTEASPVTAAWAYDDYKVGYIGLPFPSTEVSIRNDQGQELPVGEVGCYFVRGPQVMKGYWNKPEETENVLSEDGWLDTGDIAMIEEDGYMKIVDRKKDMILVSGFNVYPNEIEDALAHMEKIREVAVVGVPDARSNEQVKAIIVKNDESLTKEEVISFARERLTAYKVPKNVEFRNELPKSNVGKILRRELRKEATA